MANKDNNLNNRIKKIIPNNQWMINVGKSLGFTTMEIVQDLMPNTTDFVSWNKNDIKDTMDMVKGMRQNTGSRNLFNKQFSTIPQIKAANEILANIKEDLKTGKFVNKDREKEIENFDDLGYDYGGLFGEEDRLEFLDDEEDDSPQQNTSMPNITPTTVIDTLPLAKAISNNTEVTVKTMMAVADQQMNVETEKIMFDRKSTHSMLNALGAINDNLSLLVEFNATSTTKYQAAAMKYYEQSLQMMEEAAKREERDISEDDSEFDPFTYTGGLKLGEYKKIVSKNLKELKELNPNIGQMIDVVMDPSVLKGFAKNPLGAIINLASKAFIPGVVKQSASKLDENLSSLLPALLGRINSFEDSLDPFLQGIYKVFGYKEKLDYYVDLGDYYKGLSLIHI